jgi:hypothetical protein
MTKQKQKELFFQSSLPSFVTTPEETREHASTLIKSKLLNEGVAVYLCWSSCGDKVAIFPIDDELRIPNAEQYQYIGHLLMLCAFGESIKQFVVSNNQ